MAVLRSIFVKYMGKKCMPGKSACRAQPQHFPFPADLLSVDFSVSVHPPGWLISVGTVIPCYNISMKTLKVRTHLGGSLLWMLYVPACGVTPLGLAPPTPGTAHGDVPPCLRPPPITGSSPQPGECLASLAGVIKHWSMEQSGQAPALVSEAHRSTDVH